MKTAYLDRPSTAGDKESAYQLRRTFVKLGTNVSAPGDGISKLKYKSETFWHDVFSTDAWPGLIEQPLKYQQILNEWRLKYPESDFPDRKIIGEPWNAPRKNRGLEPPTPGL
jgi:hypothetical protein